MALTKTNLLVQMGPLPQTFRGTPSEFAAEMIKRMAIVSPSGINFIFVGDVEPTSNVGPWLKGGTSWFVFDPDTKRYVPLDITASEKTWYKIGKTTPADSDPALWLRTTQDASEADPSYGDAIGWYYFDGENWAPFNSIVLSGPTANRPAAPEPFQMFYDTDIATLIWWERGAWRTVDGVPGDVKMVAYDTLTDALLHNPGWEVLGSDNQSVRGRWISQATKDSGPTPETQLTVSSGIAERAALETFGETDGVQINSSSDVPYPPTIALWHLLKL